MIALVLATLVMVSPQTQPTSPPQNRTPSDAGAYVVGARDVLNIMIFDEPQLSGKFRVDNDGSVTFPLIGRIAAAGLTLRAIEANLTKQLAEGFLKNPQVSVEVEQYKSQSVFIIGEVRSPGKYAMTGHMSLIEALAQAGSTTSAASSEVLILHPRESSADAPLKPGDEGLADVTRANIKELQKGLLSQNVTIHDGDTIFVPKAETLFITGYVKTPGAYVMERGMTVLQALALAGGVSDRGSSRRIKILRVVRGKQVEISVKLDDLVQAGDTIQVLQRFF